MEALEYCGRNSLQDPFVVFEHEPPSHVAADNSHAVKREPEKLFETLEIQYGSVDDEISDLPRIPALNHQAWLPASELGDFLSDQDFGQIVPQLKLVRLESQLSPVYAGRVDSLNLKITRQLFDCVLDRLRANPWVRWLISAMYDGFHHMKAQDGHTETFFFGSYHKAVVWTFVPATARTKVLLINRNPAPVDPFYPVLSRYQPHLSTPYAPLMAIILTTTLLHDEALNGYVNDIIEVERSTGFTWQPQGTLGDHPFNVDELTSWSRASAHLQINITNTPRHHQTCVDALGKIKEWHAEGQVEGLDPRLRNDYDKSMVAICKSVDTLEMQATTFMPYATYIKSRAEAQIGVIFALQSHEDSISNLKLAEASKAIAAEAKRDSSAMKTIAFMTMTFLPATFLAAFFALPVFEWEHKRGVQTDGLQLYWAVTIPSTVVVFVVWLFITQSRLQIKL